MQNRTGLSPSRPALRYFGGKWRLAPWIISHFPDHTCYVEPYGGAASVLLRKSVSAIEVYNDLDGDVVHFFRVLRERTEDLVWAVELTPFSRAEYDLSYQVSDDELERARRFCVRSWQGRNGPSTQWRSSWRFQRSVGKSRRCLPDDWSNMGHLGVVASRLKRVQVECDEALKVILRYDTPGSLFYCDPPYVNVTRSDRWCRHSYQHEMSDEDHVRLAEVLGGIEGMVIVSGYHSELYAGLYGDWKCVTRQAKTDVNSIKTECLWLSPAAVARQVQLRLVP